MQRHEVSFRVDAPPHRVWRLFHPKPPPDGELPRVITYDSGTIIIHREGDENDEGLVREATFAVPKWLLSGGTARSFECIVEARKNEFARYRAVGKPLWSRAEGWHTLEPLDDGAATELTFVETYEALSPVIGRLLERRVHHVISEHNTTTYERVLAMLGPVTRLS